MSALWANRMGWDDGAALGANHQLSRLFRVVGATLARTSVGVTSFWNCHFTNSKQYDWEKSSFSRGEKLSRSARSVKPKQVAE